MDTEIQEALASAVGAGNVRAAGEADEVDGVRPRWVVTAGSTERAAAAMRVTAEHGLRVVPRGSGSKLDWGCPPEAVDVVLDMSAAREVLEHASGDLVVHVQAGRA